MGGISYTVSNPHLMGVSAGSYSLAELMFPTLCVGSDLLKCIRWLLDWSCKSYWYCLESCEFGGTGVAPIWWTVNRYYAESS